MAAKKTILLFALLTFVITVVNSQSVQMKYVNGSLERGAVCLDGSSSVCYIHKGVGHGRNNWLLHLQGGGWCFNKTNCKDRASTSYLGSSNLMNKYVNFTGFLSNDSRINPEFHSWNRVYIPYCDGSSFTGNVEAVDPVTNVTYRGLRIFEATMDDLLSQGMEDAQNALLSGVSAGGLATMIHCDRFRDLLPMTARVKCLAIASYFVHEVHLNGSKQFESIFEALISLHGSSKGLPSQCTSRMSPSLPVLLSPILLAYNRDVCVHKHVSIRSCSNKTELVSR
ncbi:unnamed protein product [Cuscuta europaea]|uniref:Pectin acetylesterase n=1 Tax=Cuscuta europaea TaxID=41803 RepID=A0A9P0VWC2_CUSEU|nr:unnamed protein product [Cuscuta europaea]